MEALGSSYPPAPPTMPTIYDTLEQMDTGLKTFLVGAAIGFLLLVKTLYEICSAMFYPPPGSSYNFDENGAAPEAAPAVPKPGASAAVLGTAAAAEPKRQPKPPGEGIAFGRARVPKQSPRSKRRADGADKASLLDEASDDEDDAAEEEPAEKQRHGNRSNGSKSCRNGRRGRGPPAKAAPEDSSSSDEATDSLKPLTRHCGSSVVSSRASHLSDRAGSTLSRGSKASRESFLKESHQPRSRERNGNGSVDPAARRLAARAPAILTCD